MSITAKEIARIMNVSEAAISMALNDKPGVSKTLKKRIIAVAEEYGYDFSRLAQKQNATGKIAFISYKKHGAVVDETPFFEKLIEGISEGCKNANYSLNTYFLNDSDDIAAELKKIRYDNCVGFLILGTEMTKFDLLPFLEPNIPVVVMDTYFDEINADYITINNIQGAYTATKYLIQHYHVQPGYLHSSYPIVNFTERMDGFMNAIRHCGMSPSKCVIHSLSPSIDGAYSDMKALLASGEDHATVYFADNDLIAIGAMKAFTEAGYSIPKDIAIIGFDNISLCTQTATKLASINVPKQYYGKYATERLFEKLKNPVSQSIKIEIATELVLRNSAM